VNGEGEGEGEGRGRGKRAQPNVLIEDRVIQSEIPVVETLRPPPAAPRCVIIASRLMDGACSDLDDCLPGLLERRSLVQPLVVTATGSSECWFYSFTHGLTRHIRPIRAVPCPLCSLSFLFPLSFFLTHLAGIGFAGGLG
jgi:hypothetical protein